MVKKLYSAMEIDLKTRYALWYRRRLHRGQFSGKAVKLSSSKDRLRSVLFFLPDKIEHIRIVEYFIKSINHSKLNGTGLKPNASLILYIGLLSSLSVLISVISFLSSASIAFILRAIAIPLLLNFFNTPRPPVQALYGSALG